MTHKDEGMPPDPNQGAAEDLRATTDAIRVDASRLADLEAEKATLHPTDPRVDRLAEEAVDLGDRIARETRVERELGRVLK